MTQSLSEIVRRLEVAQQDRKPVTIHRRHLDQDITSGFVIALTNEWVVLQDFVEGVYLDTTVLLRLDYVTKVKPHPDQAYVSRAVAGLNDPIEQFSCAAEVKTSDLLQIIDSRAGLICVLGETRKDWWLGLGKIKRIGKKRLDLHYIGRDGIWSDFVDAWKLKDITRIEFGGLYIRALEQFGDPMPQVEKRVKR